MPANFVKGDILEEAAQSTGTRALAFGADCAGTMESGIAVAIRQRWPALAEAFQAHASSGKMQLGDVFAWREGDLVVYALGIQKGGAKPKISSVERALRTAIERADAERIPRVLFPRVGGGKSGLDWARLKRVIGELAAEKPLDVVVFEQFVRKSAAASGATPAEEPTEPD
jgi:O-acetyl-ADP-ribose deacetylase (regulator of RNase III)